MTAAITDLGIAAQAAAIRAGELSPLEVVDAHLARIEALNPRLRAFISLASEQAREAARAAEAAVARGDAIGPLHGVPVAVKDLYRMKGLRRTCGSAVLDEPVSAHDATSVARLRAAGAIPLGLLNLHEFAFGPTGINPHHGTARNPWNPDYVCGGSSSGSGCAVAAGLVPGALGSDTGGSIRIPAALCGIVGLKQTYGLASRAGIWPVSDLFDHGGPMARTVEDCALLLQAIAGGDSADPSTVDAPVDDYVGDLKRPPAALRVGVPDRFFFDHLHPAVATAVAAALDVLRDLGFALDEVALPFAETASEAWNVIALSDAYDVHESRLAAQGDGLSPDVAARLRLAEGFRGVDYSRALKVRAEVRREIGRLMADVDVLVMPSAPIPSVPIEGGTIDLNGETIEGWRVLGRLTRLACFTGQPSISVPCGFSEAGLPVGLQLIGRWFEDGLLLRAAAAYEGASRWHAARPTLAVPSLP